MSYLKCPNCNEYKMNNFCKCESCNFVIKNLNGIPIFTKDAYWGEIKEEKMKEYLEIIKKNGFGYFKKIFQKENPSRFDFAFDSVRADWRLVFPIEDSWSVLDLGAGLGNSACVLAGVAKNVCAVEKSYLRAEFIKSRKEFEKLDNLDVIIADSLDLPFEDNSFDLISGNGLLEWIGVNDKFKNPREAQIYFLKELKRILKPNGYIYIGIENRFAIAYLRGLDHSGLRFTSYMPRFLANIITLLIKKHRYQTYTYSIPGYKKLIKEAGFDVNHIDFFIPLPGYNLPKYIVPYGNCSELKFLVSKLFGNVGIRRKLTSKLLKNNILLKFWMRLVYSYIISIKNNK